MKYQTKLTEYPMFVDLERLFGIVGFKGNRMKHFVQCVKGTNNSNISDHSRGEIQFLPRSAKIFGVIYYSDPIFLIHRDFNIIRIRSERRKRYIISKT